MLSGFTDPEGCMNAGKTLFAQVMEFVPWKTFGRIIAKHKGDCGVRTLPFMLWMQPSSTFE